MENQIKTVYLLSIEWCQWATDKDGNSSEGITNIAVFDFEQEALDYSKLNAGLINTGKEGLDSKFVITPIDYMTTKTPLQVWAGDLKVRLEEWNRIARNNQVPDNIPGYTQNKFYEGKQFAFESILKHINETVEL